jgi:general secretion pathway protein A
MYRKSFGLRENPFNVNPDPRYLVLTQDVREALACLTYGLQKRKGFILLTGEVGTGKTTLLNRLVDWAKHEEMSIAFVFNPRLSPPELLDFVTTDFGITCESHLKSQILRRLSQWLLERHQAGKSVALIIDEAQDLSPDALDEIRMLTNLETPTDKLLQIVLSGQPELEYKLGQPELRQLRQRLTLRCKLYPLTLEEAHRYITERLRIAGADGQLLFTPEAIEAVHAYSLGIPRVINLLCENALIGAFVHHEKTVSADRVREVANEFDLPQVHLTTSAPPSVSIGENADGTNALENQSTLRDQERQPG